MGSTTDVASYLQSKGLPIQKAGGYEICTPCIFHGEEPGKGRLGRLYINIDPNAEIPGLYYCHVCGQKGNFVTLKQHYGDHVTDAEDDSFDTFEIFDLAANYYQRQLKKHPKVVEWLRGDERGLLDDTIRRFRLGYAPMEHEQSASTGEIKVRKSRALYRYLKDLGYEPKKLLATGLVVENGDRIIDSLQGMVTIPYLVASNVVDIRGRTWPDREGSPKYKTCSGRDSRLFNTDAVWNVDDVVATEGEFDCFSGDTEVLTERGWERLDQFQGGPVAQWEEGFRLSMAEPSAYVKKRSAETLVMQTRRLNGGVSFVVTPTHRVVSTLADGSQLRVDEAQSHPKGSLHHIPRAGVMDGPGVDLTDDEFRLLLAIQADGTIDARPSTGVQYVRFGLVKDRKVHRLRRVLESLGIPSSDEEIGSGVRSLCFQMPAYLTAFKVFPWRWLVELSAAQREFILAELPHWDGNEVTDRKQHEFSSSITLNAEWVQALAHTTGRVATVMERANGHGEWRKVSILHSKRSSSWQQVQTTSGGKRDVYCLTVPSSMLLVRHQGQIAVSGNCMVMEQNGYKAVGFPGCKSWQDNWNGYFAPLKRVWLVFDRDVEGEKGAAKVIENVGPKTRRIHLSPAGVKCDPTMWFGQGHTKDDFEAMLNDARKGSLLVSVRECIDEFYEIQNVPGLQFGWELLDVMIDPGFQPTQVMILLAKTGTGKTIAVLNIFDRMRRVPGQEHLKMLFISLEQTRGEWWDRARRIYRFNNFQASDEDAENWWANHIYVVDRNRMSEAEIRIAIEDYEYQTGSLPDLVAIDYLGYFANSFKGERYERTSDAAMAIKAMAKDTKIPFLVPHQVSRIGKDGEEFGADAARDSGVIEETADFLLTMWSPDNALGRNDDEKSGRVHMRIAKSRHGGRGVKIDLQFAPLSLALMPEGDSLCAPARQEMHWRKTYRDNWEKAVFRHRTGHEGHLERVPNVNDELETFESMAFDLSDRRQYG